MAATAMHLVDKVLPDSPVRQWVLSVPFPLRRLLAADARLFGSVVKIFVRIVERFYLERARDAGIGSCKTGMLSFQQRFGGSLNANCHVHMIAIDGVYEVESGEPRFHFLPPPAHADIERVAALVRTRVTKMLRRRGLLGEVSHDSNEAPLVDSALDACRGVGQSRGRFERIDAEGRSQQELFPDCDARFVRRTKSPWAAEVDGFSVEAGVAFGALDRKGREKLARYCLRPAVASERLSVLRDGSVAYQCKYPNRGKTHRVMPPLEFMARLASIVPPPRFPLWRYHGVLAPGSKWRAQIVPDREREPECCVVSKPPKSNPVSRTNKGDPSLIAPPSSASDRSSWRPSTSHVPWAEVLKRSFELDVTSCAKCGGILEPLAIITRQEIVDRILSHLRLPLRPEPLGCGETIACDVTGEPMPDWAIGVDPEPPADARAPPDNWDGVDAPASDD